MTFAVKLVEPKRAIGPELRQARESQGWTYEKASRETQIQKSYLRAMEEERWRMLPEEPVRSHFLERYIRALGADPTLLLLAQDLSLARAPTGSVNQVPAKRFRLSINPQILTYIGLAFVLLALIGYLLFGVRTLLRPPTLSLAEPNDNFLTDVPTVLVRGETETSASITINEQVVLKTREGSFEKNIDLERGVNVITVSAKKKYSKPRTIYRTVIFESK